MSNEEKPKELSAEDLVDQLSQSKSPEPSMEQVVAEKVMSKVTEMPQPPDQETKNEAEEIPGPTEAPKITISQPDPPRMPKMPQPQKSIHLDMQMETIGRKICKIKGHTISGIVLHTTQLDKNSTPFPSQNTIVICTVCGASLAQIRG